MRRLTLLALFFLHLSLVHAQTINLGTPIIQDYLRRQQLLGNFDSLYSFNYLPIVLSKNGLQLNDSLLDRDTYFKKQSTFFNGNGSIRLLPAEFRTSFDSHHPDSRNDGAQIRSRGIQTYASLGLNLEWGILSIQIKPEFVFAQNRNFEGFLPNIIAQAIRSRVEYQTFIDLPERFGEKSHTRVTPGQSSIRLNKWGLSLGLSTENVWWGPGIRNSILLSNNAEGFLHFTLNTQRPIKTPIGSFEGQFITGRLEGSGFESSDQLIGSSNLQFPAKIDDWRYFQGFSITYSPKWIKGLSLGATRWAQQYWETTKESKDYFPIFSNFLRENESNLGLEAVQDQAAGVFGRWLFYDAQAELYFEFARNDAPVSIRDFLVDTDHSRAYTLGLNKLFDLSTNENTHLQVLIELTKASQTESRITRASGRGAGSFYVHSRVRHGYTNRGEILGSGLGSSGNAIYLEVAKVAGFTKIGGALERFTHNQDFLTAAFDNFSDFTRPWVDYNIHAFFNKKFDHIFFSGNVYYTRSVNYEWKLTVDPSTTATPFFPQVNRGNLNIDLKIAYIF